MRYVYYMLIAVLFLAPLVNANEFFKRYEITYTPSVSSNEVKIFGYMCLDDSCSSVDASKVTIYSIEAWDICLYQYATDTTLTDAWLESCLSNYVLPKETPINIANNQRIVLRYSNAAPGKKYATYYFAKDYVGRVNVFTVNSCDDYYCGDNTITTIDIQKKDRVDLQINNFQVENLHNESQPLFINVPVSVESQICNNLQFTGLVGYLPPEDGVYVDYAIDGFAHLTISDANNNILNYQVMPISVPVSTCNTNVQFQWTPTSTGNINVVLNAETRDSKVLQQTNTTASAQTYVYDSSAACQSVITNVIITDQNGDSRIDDIDTIYVKFDYNSQVYLTSSDVRPADTNILVEILDSNNNVVYSSSGVLSSQNILGLKTQTYTFSALPAGAYTLRISANAVNTLCNTLPNNNVVISVGFNVYQTTYNVEFVVRDATNSLPIEGAEIQINSNTLITDASGRAQISLPAGSYSYVVQKAGYNAHTGSIPYLNQDLTISVSLNPITTPANNPPTITSFTANTTQGYVPLFVEFSYAVSDADSDTLTCYFDFDGNGVWDKTINGCSSGIEIYSYTTAGTYNAKLRVEDGKGGYEERVIIIDVLQRTNTPPTINSFNVNPTSGYAPLDVSISWSVSDSDGDVLTCYVDVNNDGLNEYTFTSCNSNTITHTYTNAGTYTLRFRVSDGTSFEERTATIVVNTRPNNPPTITSFTANTTQGYVPLFVEFRCSAVDSDGSIANYYLDVDGDGSAEYTSINGVFVHPYTLPGNYTARCIAEDDGGLRDEATLNITALTNTPQIISFSANPTSGTYPLNVLFSFAVQDDKEICSITLNFGDGNNKVWDLCNRSIKYYSNSTTHTYTSSGTYIATLVVEDNESLTSQQQITINVLSPPTGGGGGGGGSSRGSRGAVSLAPTLTSKDVYIKDVSFPDKVYIGNSYELVVEIKSNYKRKIENLDVSYTIENTNIKGSKTISLDALESKKVMFSVFIDERFNINEDYTMKIEISKNNRRIDNEELIFRVVERKPTFYGIKIKDVYNADEPITYAFCISDAVEEVVKVYVDDKIKRIHKLNGSEGCFSGSIGNTFSVGEHTLSIANGKYEVSRMFLVERIIRIVDHNIQPEYVVGKSYKITATIEVQIPSNVVVKLVEDNKLVDRVESFIADREDIELTYTPQTTGDRVLSIVVENGKGNKAKIDKEVKVVKDSLTGNLIRYVSTAALVGGFIAFLAAILYFGLN